MSHTLSLSLSIFLSLSLCVLFFLYMRENLSLSPPLPLAPLSFPLFCLVSLPSVDLSSRHSVSHSLSPLSLSHSLSPLSVYHSLSPFILPPRRRARSLSLASSFERTPVCLQQDNVGHSVLRTHACMLAPTCEWVRARVHACARQSVRLAACPSYQPFCARVEGDERLSRALPQMSRHLDSRMSYVDLLTSIHVTSDHTT